MILLKPARLSNHLPIASIARGIISPRLMCVKIVEHKMAHSLAATENISFLDALRSVNSSSSISPLSSPSSFSDPRLDFRNFPYLSKPRSFHSPSHIFSYNRFSPQSNLSPSSGDSPMLTKPFSSILKHSAVPVPHSQTNSRNNKRFPIPLSDPISSSPTTNQLAFPFTSNLVSPYPKAHRDLLLEPHGRPLFCRRLSSP